ncbi:serine/threonine-protein phosphatase 6 regulatory ankyrin repeat subunit B-like [Patella vulgata]|uniref:serine/threonine-protein phosphatase 6 regulatory ankyrin repeat subunit B-like n=1 Tax=Patella vulgata TaxID=6465 RepID=UPI0024A9B43B|nr:serine/threonine-protein phosphatase 6 regulatory ankyrin repeat subunit B-like [Patella vulgata]
MMDSGCWCASWNAVRRDEIYKLKYLVSFPNPCVNSEQGETILMLSCRKQNLKTVSILLKHQKVKEIINKISHVEGLSALHLSIQLGRSETTCLPLVMALVEAGADVNISSREMTTPSCISACRGFMSVLAYLIDHGADVNAADQNQFTVLHHIVTKPNANLFLQKLIFAGVQINLQNKFGETPLYLATISNNEYAVNMLLETNGSCVDLADRNGITPLMLAAIQNKHGASVNKQDGRGRTSLIVAIQNGNKSATDCMLQIDSCDVNLSDNQGKSPLMLAAQSGNTELMELLYQYRADINQQDNCKRTSLYLAVESNNLKAVDILLKMNGCDVNLSDIKGKSPLMLAVQNSNTELMKLLHQHNADVDKQDGRGRSAVYYCLQQMCRGEEDSIEIMKLLECFGAEFRTQIHGNKLIKDALKHSYYYFQHLVDSNMVDFHGLDENGENILHYVARSLIGSICLGRFFSSFVKVIADQRIYINRINSKGNTPLMVAAILYNIPYMQALLQHGCSTNIRNIYGHTVLHLSIIGIDQGKLLLYESGAARVDIVSTLSRNHGADVNAVDQNQCTVLHHIVTKPNACVILYKLIIAGIRINLQNKFGETPLYLATISNNEYAVNMLLETNASCVDLADRKGITPLILAAIENEIKIIKLLHKHGASVNKQDGRGRTSLIVAIRNGNKSAVEFLLQIDSCGVNLSDNQGKSPLMLAVQSGNTELMELLHQYRADINQQDNRGRTSLYLAVESNNLRAVDVVLKMNGCDVNMSDNNGKSPLMLAVQNNNTELIERLHQHNADVNKQDGRGRSAVYYCLHQMCRDEECGIEIMKLLECFGAEFRTQNRGNILIKHVMKHSYDYFQHLVDSNMVDFDGLDKNGDNILHYLARCLITIPCFEYLLTDQRFDINRINSTGNTPLMVAAILYNIQYMKALLQLECSTNIRNIYGHTVLHLSIIGFVKLTYNNYSYHEWDLGWSAAILSSDIDVNAQDKDGQTALMLAAKLGEYKLVKQLCRSCTDCKILDKFGKSMVKYLDFYRITDLEFCIYIIHNFGVDITDKAEKTMMDMAIKFIEREYLSEGLKLISYLIAGNYSFQNLGQNRRNRMDDIPTEDVLSSRINDYRNLLYQSGAEKIDIVYKLPFMEDEHEYNDDTDAQTTRLMSKESEFHSFCNNICLKSMCRRIIRQHLGPNIQDKVTQLKVPLTVQNFLLLKCSLEDKYFNLKTEDSDDDDDDYYGMDVDYDTDEFCIDLYDSEDYFDFFAYHTCTSLSNSSSTSSLSSSPLSPSSQQCSSPAS